jgi:hypothetical protein
MNYSISRKDDPSRAEVVDVSQLEDACERLSQGGQYALNVVAQAETPKLFSAEEPPTERKNSTFSDLVTDDAAKARIGAQHAALAANGVTVDTSEQFFATGTRMADSGYSSQRQRQQEHNEKLPLRAAASALADAVRAEKREDIAITAGELGKGIKANGKITFDGLAIGEQAIRGLAARIESPMLGYVLGLRDRIQRDVRAAQEAKSNGLTATAERLYEQARLDRAEVAAVVAYECKQNPDVTLKLRARRNVGDVFAVVSPSYVPADAPEVVADLVAGMPSDARGTFAYDSLSTSWELRASVWTPTPVDEQAVGEAFEGYATFSSRDNGTSRFRGGGGVTLIRCLNASTYTANGVEVARVHRGGVRADIDAMMRGALSAIDALSKAWGTNREAIVEVPSGIKLNDAIPGFWRYCLLDRKSELAGVLPGRSEEHVKGLSAAYHDERRDMSRLVRSDLAQGWTRYIQGQAPPVRREAESAIGDWLVRGRPLGCDLRG